MGLVIAPRWATSHNWWPRFKRRSFLIFPLSNLDWAFTLFSSSGIWLDSLRLTVSHRLLDVNNTISCRQFSLAQVLWVVISRRARARSTRDKITTETKRWRGLSAEKMPPLRDRIDYQRRPPRSGLELRHRCWVEQHTHFNLGRLLCLNLWPAPKLDYYQSEIRTGTAMECASLDECVENWDSIAGDYKTLEVRRVIIFLLVSTLQSQKHYGHANHYTAS